MLTFKQFLLETQEPPEGLHLHSVDIPERGDHFVSAYHKDADTDIHEARLGGYFDKEYPKELLSKPPEGSKLGNMVGYARFHKSNVRSKPGYHFSTETYVDPEWRRQGIATKIYQHAAKTIKVVPSPAQSNSAKKFWKSNPLENKNA